MDVSQDCSEWAKGQLVRMLRESGTDKLLIESVELRYCHAKVAPRSPPRAQFDLYVMFETATILQGKEGAEDIETVDGRMMFPVMDTTAAGDIEIEVEVPDTLSSKDEGVVVTEVRKLGPRVRQLLHDKFVPALLKEAKSMALVSQDGKPPKPSSDMRAWLHGLGLSEYFETLAQSGVDLDTLKQKKSVELHQLGLPTTAGFVIRKKVEEEQASAKAKADLVRDMKGVGGDDGVDGLTEDDVRRAQVLRSHFGHALLAPRVADSSDDEDDEDEKPVDDSQFHPVHSLLKTDVVGIYFGAAGRKRAEDLAFEEILTKAHKQMRAADQKAAASKKKKGDSKELAQGAIAPEQRFEVVYVSHDHNTTEFAEARDGQPWLALQWADKRQKARLCHAYQVRDTHALSFYCHRIPAT